MKFSFMRQARFKVQRRLGGELPGLGKPGALGRRPYPPGENGNKRRKYSDYALRMEEKQKIRHHYVLKERQLRRFIRNSKKGQATTAWIDTLIGLLERRLDNIVFRLGFAPSIRAARQLVSHGHVLVNGKKLDISSCVLNQDDEVTLRDKSYEHQSVIYAQQNPRFDVPDYLKKEMLKGKEGGVILSIPERGHVPFTFDASLFTEYYAARKV